MTSETRKMSGCPTHQRQALSVSSQDATLVESRAEKIQHAEFHISLARTSSMCGAFPGVVLGRLPDGKAESDLVHKISEVVDQVQGGVIHRTHQVSEDVAERVDGPAGCDDEAHRAEGGLHVLVHLVASGGHRSSLTSEDLEEDETPSCHPDDEPSPCVDETCFSAITSRPC